MSKQPLIYIAGPYRAGTDCWQQEQNIRRAEEVAWEVFRAGAAALCPHTNTRFFQGSLPDEVWIEATLTMLRACDAVIVLPHFDRSRGTLVEIVEADRLGLTMWYLPEGNPRWVETLPEFIANLEATLCTSQQ